MNVTKPSFVLGYWRPWNEESDITESWFDYIKDKSLVEYGANTIGKFINQASQEQITAINNLGIAIGKGMATLSNQLNLIDSRLEFINRNLDLQIEQQRLSNILLHDISKLLRVPNSEKERQRSIELGIKFFINAQKDPDLYNDALEELLKAEAMMRQDYFVLHRIGCIYLYAEHLINPSKALDYFERAAKYASIETDPAAIRLVNLLKLENPRSIRSDFDKRSGKKQLPDNLKGDSTRDDLGREIVRQQLNRIMGTLGINTSKENSENQEKDYNDTKEDWNTEVEGRDLILQVREIASDSYEKAALSSYILGQSDKAINYQKKAVYYYPSARNYYYLGKYYARVQDEKQVQECLTNAKEIKPEIIDGIIYDLDYLSIPLVSDYYNQKCNNIDNEILNHIKELKELFDEETEKEIISLNYRPDEYKIYSEKYKYFKRLYTLYIDQTVKRKNIIRDIEDLRIEIREALIFLDEKDRTNQFTEGLNIQNQSLRELSMLHQSLKEELLSLSNHISVIKENQSLQEKKKEERKRREKEKKEERERKKAEYRKMWPMRITYFVIWGVLMIMILGGAPDLAYLIFKISIILYLLISLIFNTIGIFFFILLFLLFLIW